MVSRGRRQDRIVAEAEIALQHSEARYREVVDEAATIILRWDVNGNVTLFNEYAQKFFGFEAAEIIGRNVVGTIVPQTEYSGRDLAVLMREICLDPKKFEYNENENIKRNGERVWIAWRNRPLFDATGDLVEIHSVGIDISDRKRAEDALRLSEAKWRSLTQHSPDHIIMVNRSGEILFINRPVPGLIPEGAIGVPLSAQLPPECGQIADACLARVWATGEADQFTIDHQGSDGSRRCFECSVRPITEEDRIVSLIVSARDITDRKRADAALKESEERLRLLVGQSNAVLWSVDRELRFTHSVGGGLKKLGLSPDEVVDKQLDLYRFFRTDSPSYPPIEAHLRALQGESGSYEFEWQGRHYQTQIAPHEDEQGDIVGCIGVAIDITSRKLAEKVLSEAHQELELRVMERTGQLAAVNERLKKEVEERKRTQALLEASNRELESYSYSIAHDLRSPLRAITGFSQILLEDTRDKLDGDELRALDRIVTAGKHMSRLIDEILELARITRTELHYREVNLSDLGHKIIKRLEPPHAERQINWRIQADLVAKGDASLLEIVLQNLLHNAWKYTRDVSPASIELRAFKNEKETVYCVKDNGVGFDMKYQEKLFKPFHRLHAVEEFEGTGIGLATCHRVIQRHGGRIWAQARKHEGATFYFTLPD